MILDSRPDAVDRPRRIGARHRHPGARGGAGCHPLCEIHGRRGRAGRPCHQGGPDRRGPGWSSGWSTRCFISRAKAAPFRTLRAVRTVSGPARRDRRLRRCPDKGLREGLQPVGTLPRRAPRQGAGRRCSPAWRVRGRFSSKSRRWSPLSAPGTPRRAVGRLGPAAPPPWCWRCWQGHCGVRFATHDVYLKRRRRLPGSPRPACRSCRRGGAGLLLTGLALPADCVYFGEISSLGRHEAGRTRACSSRRLKAGVRASRFYRRERRPSRLRWLENLSSRGR